MTPYSNTYSNLLSLASDLVVRIDGYKGLNPIIEVGRRHLIRNYDMSYLVKGHGRYKENFEAIMTEVDFDNDFKVL
jgi:hypothetical protein